VEMLEARKIAVDVVPWLFYLFFLKSLFICYWKWPYKKKIF